MIGLLAAVALAAAAAETAPFVLPAPTTSQAIEYEADRFEYVRDSSTMRLSGSVVVRESTWTIKADDVWLDLRARRARAVGHLSLEDGLSFIGGSEGEFEFETREGVVQDARADYPPWRIHGKEAELNVRRDIRYRRAHFTSCARLPDPHYHFTARTVKVRPRRWLYATNVVFYVGGVPVFYTPFLWKSLRRRHLLRTRVTPGYDKRNGVYARTTTLYSFWPGLQGKLFLDYYGAQGGGVGNELQFRASEDARGALYGYRVREKGGAERWAVLGDHYHTVASSYSIQARLQTQSDPEFNNHYTRANAFRVTQELVNGAAFTRATGRTTTRLSYSRLDDRLTGTRFIKTRESSPRLDFQTAPVGFRGGKTLHTLRSFADNSYDRGRGFQQKSVGAGWEAARVFLLRRGTRLTPRLAYEHVYEDRRDAPALGGSTRTYVDAFTGRYDVGGTLRFANPLGDTDLGHHYRRRLKPNAFSHDGGSPDYGVESNLITLGHALRPDPRVYVRVESGYDFRGFREQAVGFRRRVQPFAADFTFIPRRGPSVSLHNDYHIDEGNRNFIVQADWGQRDATFYRLGAANTASQAGHYFLSQEFGYSPATGTWQVAGALRSDVRSLGGLRFDSWRLFEKELSLTKDFHDFHTRLVLRDRPGGVQEAQIRVELRLETAERWRRQVYTDYSGR